LRYGWSGGRRRGWKMTQDRIAQIEAAITEMEQAGLHWTNAKIFQKVSGNYQDLSQYLKERRAAMQTFSQAAASLQARRAEASVAVEEPPEKEPVEEPEEAPAPDLPPLLLARWERDRTAEREHQLGVQEAHWKQQRHALEEAIRSEEYSGARQHSDTSDLESRRRLRALRQERERVEAARLKVSMARRDLHVRVLETNDEWENVRGQAARWLRRLREAQRLSGAGATAHARGDAREAAEEALAALARLIGRVEAAQLAADASLQPSWL
jgi:hypothetical protein